MSEGVDLPAISGAPPRLAAFIGAAIAILAALLVLGWWAGKEQDAANRARQMVRLSYANRILADQVLIDLMSLESAQRGYVIAGNSAFLAPYRPSRQALDGDLAHLATLYRGDPAQSRKVATLRRIVDAKTGEMDQVIALRRAGQTSAAVERVSDSVGRLLMEHARAAVHDIVGTEDASLRRLVGIADRKMRDTRLTMLALLVAVAMGSIIVLHLAWLARVERHHITARGYELLARLRAVFERTTDGIVIVDPNGTIENANPAAMRMLGYAPGEVDGRDVSKLLAFARGDGGIAERIGIVDGVLAQPIRVDQTALHRDGHEVPVDVALGLMPLADGVHIVANLRDVSDRRAAEKLKDDFISTVSHELRTPLTSVLGSLGLLRAPTFAGLPHDARRLIEIADNNSRRLIRLINDILDIDRIHSGQSRLKLEVVDLRALAERARDDAEGLATAARTSIVLRTDGGRNDVVGDEERLLQVIGNLLSNAIRFSPVDGEILIDLHHRGRRAILTVEDQGPGVPAEFRNRLFERFAQSDAGASIPGGSGLGLTISREIVRAHGGDIWFEEGAQGGARFCMALDLQAASARSAAADRPTVLVCEDEPDLAATLRQMIEAQGYEVDVSRTVREAIAMAAAGDYAGVVLDLLLPDASGLSAVRALRAGPRTGSLPIIVVSALAAKGEGDPTAKALDVVDWIDKPVDHDRLLRALKLAMRKAHGGKPTLLHIDDDPDMLDVTAMGLAGKGRMLRAETLAAARAILAHTTPDIVILDLNLPDGLGLELLPELFAVDGSAVPTIIYSASELPLDLGHSFDAVLVKSRHSLHMLEGKIGEILDQRQQTPGDQA